MGKLEKLYQKAIEAPNNFLFQDLCSLASKLGFEFKRQSGSHKIYNHPDLKKVLNLQPQPHDNKIAKPYQVKQLLKMVEDYKLI